MTNFFNLNGLRIFDYPKFAEPLKDKIRNNAEAIAKEAGVTIEYINKSKVRKEDLIKKHIEKRGDHPGIVHILSVLEPCPSYQSWHNKGTGKTYLKRKFNKCLHYYFYFFDEYLGYGYIRVPTWCPFTVQVYFNGHNILASELDEAGISYTMVDNAFDNIDNFEKAQEIVDNLDVKRIHKKLDGLAAKFAPVHKDFNQVYHWSIFQVEYATDIVFKKQSYLQAIYSDLVATAIHTVKPKNISTFLGKKLDPRYTGEVGNNYHTRIEGSRIKHVMGNNSIKMYDKFGKILRIETTSNDISFFKHYREVEHRDGSKSMKYAALKKNIYSLRPVMQLFKPSNRRYMEFISAIESKNLGRKRLDKISQSKSDENRNYKGFNFFDPKDVSILLAILKGEFNISGFQNKNLRKILPTMNGGQISRLIKRMKVHGLIKRVAKTYKYYVTKLGQQAIINAQKIKEMVLIPALNY
jgi:predicted transcriptional regulator